MYYKTYNALEFHEGLDEDEIVVHITYTLDSNDNTRIYILKPEVVFMHTKSY